MAWLTSVFEALSSAITTLLSGIGGGAVDLFNDLFVDSSGEGVVPTYLAYGMIVGLVLVIGLATIRFITRIFGR